MGKIGWGARVKAVREMPRPKRKLRSPKRNNMLLLLDALLLFRFPFLEVRRWPQASAPEKYRPFSAS
jgi:hypothetical protein